MGMFSNFMDDIESPKVNKGLLDFYINKIAKEAPDEGLTYKETGKENEYVLVSNKFPEVDISAENFPEYIKKKGINTLKELREYMYRTQQTMIFDTAKMKFGKYEVDPRKIFLNPMEKDPYPIKNIEKFYLFPPKFPNPHLVEFNFDGIKESFLVQRQPLDSKSKLWFKSVDKKPIIVSYYLDEIASTISITMDFKVIRCNDFSEAYKYSKIMDSFYTGTTKMFEFQLPRPKPDKDQAGPYNDYNTRLMEKICALEDYFSKILKTEFTFNPQVELEDEDHLFIHELYYSLILDKPFKEQRSIQHINIDRKPEDKDFYDKILSTENKHQPAAFLAHRSERRDLLGKEISIYLVENFAAIKIISVDYTEEQIILTVEEMDNGFTSGFYYTDPDLKNKESSEWLSILLKAEEIKF
ncbi:abortive infection system toxin AbiGii family protein [Enterococcus faecalis]|uniref:abortive infection system toxin AbiGii family protein n=1 Tax=Enterococcus faecalis TaxID=1351 RepID=UPI0015749A9C|nr:hypothetical protein [Enterococcus faecalis]